MTGSEFDRLLTLSVPHILEKIFFSLDYMSFAKCVRVCRSWNDLLATESFQRRSKAIFGKGIRDDLTLAAIIGNTDMARSILSSPVVSTTPLLFAASKGYADVVKVLLDRGSDPNETWH